MSKGHREFDKLIDDLRKANVVSSEKLTIHFVTHFERRLTKVEDAVNEILGEEVL